MTIDSNNNVLMAQTYFFQDQQDIIKILLNKHDVISFQRTLKGCEL